jgi:predicted esterase
MAPETPSPITAQPHAFTATLDCHYLLHIPERIDASTLLILTLHGFGSNPEVMLQLTGNLVGATHAIASIEAPSAFFLSTASGEVGHSWVTSKHSASAIRLHHEMVMHVLEDAGRSTGILGERRMLMGFSQPVGLNYRFAGTHPDAVRGVIGICGGVPKNWEDGPFQKVTAALLHIARREDEYYSAEVTSRYADRLRLRADDVEFHMLEGGHRMPSKAGPIVEHWIERVFRTGSSSPRG